MPISAVLLDALGMSLEEGHGAGHAHLLHGHPHHHKGYHGTEPPRSHGLTARRQLNGFAVGVAVAVPVAFFVVTAQLMTSQIYYTSPETSLFLVGVEFFLVLVIAAGAIQAHRKQMTGGGRSWWSFVFFTSLLGLKLGLFSGHVNYRMHMRRYYDYISLRREVDLDPSHSQGQQELDVGQIDFKAGTKIDRSLSMAYHKTRTWCVAPIVPGDDSAHLANYDFWAVGMDCCSSQTGRFTCAPTYTKWESSSKPPAGIRVMDASEINGYKLAVTQAKSQYNIQSRRPIFLYMTKEPYVQIRAYYEHGLRFAEITGALFFILHCILVYNQARSFGTGEASGYLDIERTGKKPHHPGH